MRYSTGYHANTDADGPMSPYPLTIKRPRFESADGRELGGTVRSVTEAGAGVVWLFRSGCAFVNVSAPLLYGFLETEPCVCTLAADGTIAAVRAAAVGDITMLDDVRHEIGCLGFDTVVVE